MAVSELDKTPLQELIEHRDLKRRDIQTIVRDLYHEHKGNLKAVADELTGSLEGTTQDVSAPTLYRWIKGWDWKIRPALVIPDDQAVEAVA